MRSALNFLLSAAVVISVVTAGKLSAKRNEVVEFSIEDKKESFLDRLFFAHLTHNKEIERPRLGAYKYTNCGDAKTDLANVTGIFFGPDPIDLPGPLNVNFTVKFKQDLESPLRGDVILQRKVGTVWITIPCIDNIGSCNYTDICTFLAPIPECPPEFTSRGIPCQCPFKSGGYSLPWTTFQVTTPVFPTGDYRLGATVKTSTNKRVGCAKIEFSFA